MDWSSFFPDMIVASITGVIIGLIVLGTERRLSRLAAERSTREAQETAVLKTERLLGAEELYFDSSSLLPHGRARFDEIQAQAESVPRQSTPSRLSFQYLEEVALAWSDMKNASAQIEARLPGVIATAFDGFPPHGRVEQFRAYMHSVFPPAHGPGIEPESWKSFWRDCTFMPAEPDFLEDVRHYLDARGRFHVYRIGMRLIDEPRQRRIAQENRDAAPGRWPWQRWRADRQYRADLSDGLRLIEATARTSVAGMLQAPRPSLGPMFDE